MSKPRSLVADFGVYVIVRIAVCFVQLLSFDQARAFAKGLAWLAYHIDKRHREVARENLERAFPGRWPPNNLTALVRSLYVHFCTIVVEMILLPRKLHARNWRRHLNIDNAAGVIDGLTTGRPLLILTGHFGNWELAGYVLGLFGFKTYAVARPLDNPFVDDYLRRFRESTGQKLLAKKGDFERMQEILSRGGAIATLADQDAGQRGLFVDFFGRPASTHKAIALLAFEYRVPLAVVGVRKVGEPLRYQIDLGDVLHPDDFREGPAAVRDLTQRFTSSFERLVRQAPVQYFWLHRRWKHQPVTGRRRAA